MESLKPRELAQRLEAPAPPALLDVRESDEFAYASIDGARNVPLRELPEALTQLEGWKDREVVVYCHHGIRSRRAAQILVRAGFARVYNLTGGIDRWSVEVDARVRRY